MAVEVDDPVVERLYGLGNYLFGLSALQRVLGPPLPTSFPFKPFLLGILLGGFWGNRSVINSKHICLQHRAHSCSCVQGMGTSELWIRVFQELVQELGSIPSLPRGWKRGGQGVWPLGKG